MGLHLLWEGVYGIGGELAFSGAKRRSEALAICLLLRSVCVSLLPCWDDHLSICAGFLCDAAHTGLRADCVVAIFPAGTSVRAGMPAADADVPHAPRRWSVGRGIGVYAAQW